MYEAAAVVVPLLRATPWRSAKHLRDAHKRRYSAAGVVAMCVGAAPHTCFLALSRPQVVPAREGDTPAGRRRCAARLFEEVPTALVPDLVRWAANASTVFTAASDPQALGAKFGELDSEGGDGGSGGDGGASDELFFMTLTMAYGVNASGPTVDTFRNGRAQSSVANAARCACVCACGTGRVAVAPAERVPV